MHCKISALYQAGKYDTPLLNWKIIFFLLWLDPGTNFVNIDDKYDVIYASRWKQIKRETCNDPSTHHLQNPTTYKRSQCPLYVIEKNQGDILILTYCMHKTKQDILGLMNQYSEPITYYTACMSDDSKIALVIRLRLITNYNELKSMPYMKPWNGGLEKKIPLSRHPATQRKKLFWYLFKQMPLLFKLLKGQAFVGRNGFPKLKLV